MEEFIVFANGQGYCFLQESVGLKGSSQGSFQGKDSFESTDSVHPNGRVPIDRSSRGALASLSLHAMNRVRALGFLP